MDAVSVRIVNASVPDLTGPLSELAEHSLKQLRAAVAEFKNVSYANSLGSESMVLTDLIWSADPDFDPPIDVFTVDTGRLFPETYDLIDRLQQRYGRPLRIIYPESTVLEAWVGHNGINGFRDGLEQRRACCGIRKVEPFRRAIASSAAWVTGIRRGQSASRALAAPVEWDSNYGLHKVSPLLEWSETDIWDYIRQRRLPYNTLHDRGFPSIGCAPCTRAIEPGDDERAGRWWWERGDSRECGLHPRRKVALLGAVPAAAAPPPTQE